MIEKEMVYNALTGQLYNEQFEVEGISVRNDFREGSECDRLYNEIFAIKICLNRRLGTEDDPDVDYIFQNMFRIMHIISLSMFEYGFAFGEKNQVKSLKLPSERIYA